MTAIRPRCPSRRIRPSSSSLPRPANRARAARRRALARRGTSPVWRTSHAVTRLSYRDLKRPLVMSSTNRCQSARSKPRYGWLVFLESRIRMRLPSSVTSTQAPSAQNVLRRHDFVSSIASANGLSPSLCHAGAVTYGVSDPNGVQSFTAGGRSCCTRSSAALSLMSRRVASSGSDSFHRSSNASR